MPPFVYRNGDLNDLMTKIAVRIQVSEERADELMREVVAEAAIEQRTILEMSVTPTGMERARTEGKTSLWGSTSTGRVDSGHMVNTILSHVERDGSTVTGAFGHFDPEMKDIYQEDGTRYIEATHALLISFIQARERLFSGIVKLAKEFAG